MNNQTIKIVRIDQVAERTCLPKPSIYRLMADGKFPKSIKLSSRATGWLSTDIDDWILGLKDGAQS
jgi:prophage regulatory protein